VRWKSLWCVHREFSYESAGERILKIGPHLPKLLSNIKGLGFLEHGAVIVNAYQCTKFQLLAPLVSEIWRGSQNKKWELLISPDAASRHVFTWSHSTWHYLQMPTSVPNLNFLTLLVSKIKRGSRNLMFLCVLHASTLWNMAVLSCNHSSVHHAVIRICICRRLSIVCVQKLGFGGFWGWRCENIVF